MSAPEPLPRGRAAAADDALSTQWLLTRTRGGDGDALDALIDHAEPRVRAQVRRRLGRQLRERLESGDVAQEVLLETARSAERLPNGDGRSFWRWLARVVENCIRHAARTERRKPLVPARAALARDLYVEDAPSRPAAAGGSDAEAQLLRAIDGLSDDHRQVIRLRHFEGLPFPEIGRRMGRSERAVWMLHKRAQVELAAHFHSPRPD